MAQVYGIPEGHTLSVSPRSEVCTVTRVETGVSYTITGPQTFGPFMNDSGFWVSGDPTVTISEAFSEVDRTPDYIGINPALSACGTQITDMLVAMRTNSGGGRLRLTPGVTYNPLRNSTARTLGGSYLHPAFSGAIMVPPGRFTIDGQGALLKMATNGQRQVYVFAERDRIDVVTGPMEAGANVFQIGSTAAAAYAVGDKVLWRLGDISYDAPETLNYKHARVSSVDTAAGTVTLDRHLALAWDGTGTYNCHLYKIANNEGSVFGDFEFEPLTMPDTHAGSGMMQSGQNEIKVRSLYGRGIGGAVLSMQYCENVQIGAVTGKDNPNTASDRGVVMRIAECRGIRVDALTSENMGRHALIAEAGSEITVGTLRNHNTIAAGTGPGTAIISANGNSKVHVEKVLMTGLGGNALYSESNGGRVTFGEVFCETSDVPWVLPSPGPRCRSITINVEGVEERYEADTFHIWDRIIWLTDGMNASFLAPVNGGVVTECLISFGGTTSARPVQDDFTNLNVGRSGGSTNLNTLVPAVADGLPVSFISAYSTSIGAYAGNNQWSLRAQRPGVSIVTPASGRSLNGSGKYIRVKMKVHPNVNAAQIDMGTAPYLSSAGQWEPEASKTHDFGSIAANAAETTTLTVTGAAMGDIVEVSLGISHGGLIVSGYVSASNTVTVEARNPTAAAIDLASTTIRARTSKPRLGA